MGDLSDRIAKLSPEKRAILERRLLERRSGAGEHGIPRRAAGASCPLSFTEERLWFLDKLSPGSIAYNEPTGLRLRGTLDVAALKRALSEISRRHETLRTGFPSVEGEPMQVIAPPEDAQLPLVDLGELPPDEREDEAIRIAGEEAHKPFDLSTGPMVRYRLIRLSDEDHILVTVFHHIVTDGWSMGVFFRELAAIYESFVAGEPSPLKPLPVQYADFAAWQRARLNDDALEKDFAYWEEKLRGFQILELATDRPRGPAQTFAGARKSFAFTPQLTSAVDMLSRNHGVTRYMTLLAAYVVLFQRYTGQDDVTVGSPIASRNRSELEGLIGFFANTIALRVDLSGDPTIRELLGQVRETALGAYEHQDMPFGKLVERLQPERDLRYPPLCQVMFAYQNVPRSPAGLVGLACERFEFPKQISKFDITLFMGEHRGGLDGTFEYNSDLFDESTLEQMAGHFEKLLSEMAENPEARISTLGMLSPSERRRVLADFNDTATEYPREGRIEGSFRRWAQRTPDAAAVISDETTLTYAELDARSDALAERLAKSGVASGDVVGLSSDSLAEVVVAMLAILKAGGAYLPIDSGYPDERIAFMLTDAGAKVVLAQAGAAARFADCDCEVIVPGEEGQAAPKTRIAPTGATAETPACIFYTSGSTGRPKGTLVAHRGILRLVLDTNYVDIEPDDRIGQASTISFDAATFEIWGALLNGAAVVDISKEDVLSPSDFAARVAKDGVNVMFLTTTLFNELSRAVPEAFADFKCLMFGGEVADAARTRDFLKVCRPKRLLNAYGPTENTTFTTMYAIEEVPEDATNIPIGKPISNTRVYILDAHLRPTPVGVPGELFIGGDGVALGYVNRDELTADRFIADVFSEKAGGTLYRTGDIARWLADGNIEFLGRADDQVKIRGFRIEPGEIEATIRLHPGVDEAAVICREDTPGEKRLVAYFVPVEGSKTDGRQLKRFLREKLPDYMVPTAYVAMDTLAMTASGKLDRRSLPPPDAAAVQPAGEYVTPRTPVEEALARIWAEELHLERVGVCDDFFALGGHSLLAVRVFTRIEKTFGKKLPLATLFAAPTIEHLAASLGEDGPLDLFPPMVTIEKGDGGIPFFGVATADAFIYAELSRSLGPDQPFYGLHPQGIIPPENARIEIADLAAEYIRLVKTVQPTGPYHLGGMCAGGVVAYEMARQLVRGGDEVAIVALIDTPGPFSRAYKALLAVKKATRFGDHMVDHAVNLWKLPSSQRKKYILTRLSRLRRKLRGEAVEPATPRKVVSVDRVYWMAFNAAYMDAMSHYKPGTYPGKVALFLAEDAGAWRFSPARVQWARLARGGADSYDVPGVHSEALYKEQAALIAKELARYLAQSREGSGRN